MKSFKFLLLAMLAVLATGCAAPSHYHWGEYEQIVYQSYMEPGSLDPLTQIEMLNRDIQDAKSKGKPTPPGVHAHLGYMYFLNGDRQQAFTAFNEEISLFPESEVFINGLLSRGEGF